MTRYAGFWIRFLAYIIDSVILMGAFMLIGFIVGFIGGFAFAVASAGTGNIEALTFALQAVMTLVFLVLAVLYFALMESSKRQATFGKSILGLKVVGEDMQRISFGRALGRYFAKYLSGLILYIGYIMIGFTEKKQGLHDMIAGTYVVYAGEATEQS